MGGHFRIFSEIWFPSFPALHFSTTSILEEIHRPRLLCHLTHIKWITYYLNFKMQSAQTTSPFDQNFATEMRRSNIKTIEPLIRLNVTFIWHLKMKNALVCSTPRSENCFFINEPCQMRYFSSNYLKITRRKSFPKIYVSSRPAKYTYEPAHSLVLAQINRRKRTENRGEPRYSFY